MGRAALASPTARLAQQARRLELLGQRMMRAVDHAHNARRSEFRELQSRLWRSSPLSRVSDAGARYHALRRRLEAAGFESLRRARERLAPLLRTLHAVSPLATLARGYAIVSNERGEILRDAAAAAPGTTIEARLGTGTIRAKVEQA
jgi:exodeoxyribonuclease VII large subunit